MTGLNLAFSLMLALLIFQHIGHQLGLLLAALVAACWFSLTSALILTVHPFFALFGRKKAPPPKLPIDARTSDGIVSLQHQLKLCLEYGDVETAEKIAAKLQKASLLAQQPMPIKQKVEPLKPLKPLEPYKQQAEQLNKLFYSSK
jgi:hypothetical protein